MLEESSSLLRLLRLLLSNRWMLESSIPWLMRFLRMKLEVDRCELPRISSLCRLL